MNWKKIACTALAVPILYVGGSLNKSSDVHAVTSSPKEQGIEEKVEDENLSTDAWSFSKVEDSYLEFIPFSDDNSFTIPLLEEYSLLEKGNHDCSDVQRNSEGSLELICEKKRPKREGFEPEEWFFDKTSYELSTNVQPESIVIQSLYDGDGKVMAKYKGILSELKDSDGNPKDWGVFERFFYLPGVGVDLLMAEFEAGSEPKANKTLVAWFLTNEWRYYPGDFGPFKDKNWFLGMGHTHISLDYFVKDIDLVEIKKNNPEVNIFPDGRRQVDVFSLDVGYNFEKEDLKFQGRFTYHPYETLPVWILEAPFNEKKRKDFDYTFSTQNQLSYEFSPGIEFSLSFQSQIPKKSRNRIPTDFRAEQRFGMFNIFYEKSVGGSDDSIELNPFGFHIDKKRVGLGFKAYFSSK